MLFNNFCSVSEEIFLNLNASVPSLTEILLKVSLHNCDTSKTFALSTEQSLEERFKATSNEALAILSIS